MFIHDGINIPYAPPKDPDSVMDYGCNYTSWLAKDEVIGTSIWLVDGVVTTSGDPLVTSNPVLSGAITGVTLTLGVENDDYTLTNRITTDQGRTEDRSMIIQCRSK